ncbi:MAG: O-fucosyltransferase family protein [Acidobacteriota bacterium]|nr:O-fucosyltransferase family protein [Acidobacteriota bacterium]MDH3530009.1 O-fucosyltransferase family protein [Acidobacteriota bacterium]
MIYFENASHGKEGFNTHLLSYTLCISLSEFLRRDFFFDFEIPCSTPPDFASREEYQGKFDILLNSGRSLVSDLVKIPGRRVFEIDRDVENKISLQLAYSHFVTTEEIKAKFENTIIWNSFAIGRIPLTREELLGYDLIEWTHTKLANPSAFYFLNKSEKNALLEKVRIRYSDDLEDLVSKIRAQFGKFYSFHLRLGDFIGNYESDEYSVEVERFKKFVRATFSDDSIPVLAATDGLYEKEMFADMFEGYKLVFIDELVFDEFHEEYKNLEFTDFNSLSIINQLLCANAEIFIGTYRSTFTTVIHRLRQERFRKTDFNFFPDGRVATLLDADYQIQPDQSGFFEWNKYSPFTTKHEAMAWMREWNYEMTSLDF